LVARGDAVLSTGDIASARLFYQRGAEGGDPAAALRLGETFDPAFLARAGMATVPGDAKKAAFWYRRASELGIGGAALLLRNIAPAKQQ
jgi:TPR repeat protein